MRSRAGDGLAAMFVDPGSDRRVSPRGGCSKRPRPGDSNMSKPRNVTFMRMLLLAVCLAASAVAKDDRHDGGKKWVASWTTAPQSTFAGVNAPRLVNLAFPFTPASPGVPATVPQATNQTLRMIVKPDLWGDTMRVRLSNYWGTGAVTFGKVTIGLHSFSGATVAGTNRTLSFSGKQSVTVAAGTRVFSDEVKLSWARGGDDEDGASAVEGRNLAISMYIPGHSGPMTFHSTALQESFLGAPNSGDHSSDDSDAAYPYETPSWFFVDAVDVLAPADTRVLVGAGSSSVDGSITTPGNNDRLLNWMSRRLHDAYGQHVSVVNAGIGGDTAAVPGAGQTRPLREVLPERFDRDVLGASGITDVVFYAGTNTATYVAHDEINQFILHSGVFDSLADFYGATIDPNNVDPVSGFPVLRADYQIHSDPDGTPDFLHLGRNGAQAEANTLDIGFFAPSRRH